MGASSSKSAVAPILPASSLSASQVAEAVKALGEPYIPYTETLERNGMDGAGDHDELAFFWGFRVFE